MDKRYKIFFFALADLFAAATAFFTAYFLRSAFGLQIQAVSFYYGFAVISVWVFLLVFYFFRLYDKNRHSLSISYFADFLRAFSVWGVFLLAFSFFTKTDYSRAVVLMFFCFAAVFSYFVRLFLAWFFGIRSERTGDKQIIDEAERLIRLCNNASSELPMLTDLCVRRAPGSAYRVVKRLTDIVLALSAMAVVLPLAPFIIFFIKRDSWGRAIFCQKRVGEKDVCFSIYKFRTMYTDVPHFAPAPRNGEDGRVTRVGAFLRRYSLDELPQIWNVLKGEMSIVGPRPEMPFVVEKYESWQKMRLSVKPGITGLWQILGRKDLPLEENLEYDLYYVFNQSLFLDLAIILRTLPHLIFPKGAY